MGDCVRVEWEEPRDGEFFSVIAERLSGAWSFFDRSWWELCWHPLPVTAALVRRAEAMLSEGRVRIAA